MPGLCEKTIIKSIFASCGRLGRRLIKMQPSQAFVRKYVPRRLKPGSVIESADMKMHFWRAFAFARQGGPAPSTESAQPAGRRIEFRYLPFGYNISIARERHEHGDRRTAMLAAAVAMAPRNSYRFTGGDKSHRAAQAPAFNLLAHPASPPFPESRFHSVHRGVWRLDRHPIARSVKPAGGRCISVSPIGAV
jgi:hypothetical protein